MNKSIRDILNNFINARLSQSKLYSAIGTVKSVDLNKKICTVELLTGETLTEVRLETSLKLNGAGDIIAEDPTGFVLVPAVDSSVIVSYLDQSEAFISMFSEISNVYINADLTIFNGGTKGGLINIVDLASKLNDMVGSLNTELIKISSAISGLGGVYTRSNISSFSKSDFEDTTIKH